MSEKNIWELNPELAVCRGEYDLLCKEIIACFGRGNKLLLCGNGGSSADCAHITGELVKGFVKKRPLPSEYRMFEGWERLQCGLPAIDLTAQCALISAVSNDLGGEWVYAQQIMAYGQPGDILLGISTSGNARNICNAMRAAKAKGLITIGLTGDTGGVLNAISDICLKVPSAETYRAQEYHLALYHAFCMEIESAFFDE